VTSPPPDSTDELAGRLQAAMGEGYQVERALGAGGFAVVYLVRDLSLKRRLAVKVLSPDLITSRTVLERFRREAETVAQLSHPHIVPLHFIGQKDDLLYLVMECIDGGSLADRIEKEGRLPPSEVGRILREVASALDHAHKRGVIHRDIKPHNVLIEPESGRTLVTDFGIARTAEGGSLTATGMLVGTPAYLSPEQVAGEGGDHRADIYALGVVAYEMLTGQPPFTGPTPTAVLMKRLGEPPPALAKVRPEAPELLRDVIEGMLTSDPAQRFQSGGDVVRALDGLAPASGGHPTGEHFLKGQRKRRQTRILGLTAAGVLVAGAALAFALTRGARPAVVSPLDPGMALIPGGSYTVGADDGPPLSRPAHGVQLAAFGIDLREVTAGDYATFVATGRVAPPWTAAPDSGLPVSSVTYAEAAAYCGWRHPPDGRLPTEPEWEVAARGQAARRFPWGDAWKPGAAVTQSAGRGGPAPTGSLPPGATPEGILDLVGNVWEWTASPMAPYPGAPPIPGVQPSQYYVIRGGAYNTPDSTATPTLRGYAPPAADRSTLDKTGFRCAMTPRSSEVDPG
jgi:formylglycine-generating enzyme required for sulfatase activity/tRNA A-37 threonylcarbamoyl transferase component Bud32